MWEVMAVSEPTDSHPRQSSPSCRRQTLTPRGEFPSGSGASSKHLRLPRVCKVRRSEANPDNVLHAHALLPTRTAGTNKCVHREFINVFPMPTPFSHGMKRRTG